MKTPPFFFELLTLIPAGVGLLMLALELETDLVDFLTGDFLDFDVLVFALDDLLFVAIHQLYRSALVQVKQSYL